MAKRIPNQVIRPPKLFLIWLFLAVACIKVGRWVPAYAQPLEGAALGLMGVTLIYAKNLLPHDWRDKANEGVNPFYKIPKGGKHVKGFVVALALALMVAGAVSIATWAIKQLNLQAI
jgi:hypothetical protein